jgi:hypothetical protein
VVELAEIKSAQAEGYATGASILSLGYAPFFDLGAEDHQMCAGALVA